MNFFAAQDSARRTSKWLVFVYLLVSAHDGEREASRRESHEK
jgi:hypothetical protein